MKNYKNKSAERPISKFLLPVRTLIRFLRFLKQYLLLRNKLNIGKNVSLGRSVQLRCPYFFTTGNNVVVGSWFIAETNVKMGNDILISSKVSFIGNDHKFDDPECTIYSNGRNAPNTTTLEGDNLIGFGSILVGNVTIGKGCIVGAGSLVTKNLPPYTICAGVPAKVIRNRY